MSVLFDAVQIGHRTAKNRFVRSAAYEGMADADGRVTPQLLKLYRTLSAGDVGTIITGFMAVAPEGRCVPRGMRIDWDELTPGLGDVADAIKSEGALAVFQIYHAGAQTTRRIIGTRPKGPSGDRRDHMLREKPSPLTIGEIAQVVADFAAAARRAKEAGADGVQVHAAHGYLPSQFLSPFFNQRTDAYGGDREGRYRILGEIISAIRASVGREFLVLVKMNTDDGTPESGMTPELAAYYASRMREDGIDGLEISAGSTTWAPFLVCRGEAQIDDFTRHLSWPRRILSKRRLLATPRPPFREAYNVPPDGTLKAALGSVPLALVGGMRTMTTMEECVSSGKADLISLCRPLIREPGLVRRLRAEPAAASRCISCSRCLAAAFKDLPVRCYVKGLPV